MHLSPSFEAEAEIDNNQPECARCLIVTFELSETTDYLNLVLNQLISVLRT